MLTATIFLPLLGAVIAGLFGNRLGSRISQLITVIPLLLSATLSCFLLYHFGWTGETETVNLFTWINVESLEISWVIYFDTLTAVMVFVVTLVSGMVHVYSIGYMSEDPHIPRFMSYLSLFTFFMLMLVTSNNLLQMFFGWEGVGLCSYLLIGFWFKKNTANAAAIKAFLVNRVGDFGFLLGILAVFYFFETLQFEEIFKIAPDMVGKTFLFLGMEVDVLTTICLLLFIGAMGKSAQIGLHTWLPDAMEGPTPVSALIHAATMVTAGVFMVVRLSPMFEYAPLALTIITIIGASTAFFAATIGLTQWDIKRVIAYSTCSQLGYMFFAVGVGAYPAAIFHLMTHAFFKALLFLGSGSVIHGMHDEQDMRRMGGLFSKMKITGALMWIGSLALAGVPLFSGYYSKDIILESAFASHTGAGYLAYWAGIMAAFMTAFYSWRLLFLTFHGSSRADKNVLDKVHESPPIMIVPLLVLSLGAIFSGWFAVDYFVGQKMNEFWGSSILMLDDIIEKAHHIPSWAILLPTIVGLTGIICAWVLYIKSPNLLSRITAAVGPVYKFIYNKWYFDELYDLIFVRPCFYLGRGLWKSGDGYVIDAVGPDGIADSVLNLAKRAGKVQSGYLYHYAFAMMIGVLILITWFLFGFFQ